MPPDPKVVAELANKIVQTETLLEELRGQWDALFAVKRPRAKRDGSFTAKVKAYVLRNPGQQYTIEEVATALEADATKTGRALYKLYTNEEIANPERGKYCAPKVA